MIASLISVALAMWGYLSPINIRAVDKSTDGSFPVVAMSVASDQDDCTIYLSSAYYSANLPMQLHIIVHEVGHCLGLGHQPQSAVSVMVPSLGPVARPTSLDFATLGIHTRHSLFVAF